MPIPYAKNAPPKTKGEPSPTNTDPVVLGSFPQHFVMTVSDSDALTFIWTLSRDGYQSAANLGPLTGDQTQEVTITPYAGFGTQKLKVDVSDGVNPDLTYQWTLEGS